uniref:Uncharacterized protein n=1 Tax=Anguilla anguilla TaxID=7936 RepID=A0A0E9Q7X9_ANGAN
MSNTLLFAKTVFYLFFILYINI